MPRALLKTAKVKDLYLQKTEVENLFIYEFLPSAPGEYVKVYLFGLMYAQNDLEMDVAKYSRIMKIAEEDILAAWGYWAKRGLLKIWHNNDNTEYEIEYLSLMEGLYGKNSESEEIEITTSEKGGFYVETGEEDAISKVVNMEIQAIFEKYESMTGRMLSVEDARKIGEAITTYSILPDIMSFSVEYCIGEDKPAVSQIIRTAINWAKEGCHNLADVKEYLDKHSERINNYNAIFREMGFSRLPNPPDREMMDRWFDEFGYTIGEVLDACRKAAGLREPSLRYVNKVLENKRLEQGGIDTRKTIITNPEKSIAEAVVSKKVLKEYYEFIRSENEKEFREHQEHIYKEIAEIRELMDLENKINSEMMSLNLGSGNAEHKQELREQRKELEREKRSLLVRNGYREDYLDRKYKCKLCKDTGLTDEGKVCSCTKARAIEALEWNKTRI